MHLLILCFIMTMLKRKVVIMMTNSNNVKLTSLSSKGGCGCKIGPADLAQVLRNLPPLFPIQIY